MNYRPAEVRALVENYQHTRDKVDTAPSRLHHLVRVADIDRALDQLNPVLRAAVLLVGQLHLTLAEAGRLLGVHPTTVLRRYEGAMEELTTTINGG